MTLSPAFLVELEKENFQGNIVIKIDDTYFSQYQVDSGLIIPQENLGVVDTLKINGSTLDLRKSKTPVTKASLSLLDKNEVITTLMGASVNQLQSSDILIYFGFITGSFAFTDYAKLATNKIRKMTKVSNSYSLSTEEIIGEVQSALFNIKDQLDGAITNVAVSLNLQDAADFPVSGILKIEDEFVSYTGKTDNLITGLSRGAFGSSGVEHDNATDVSLVTQKVNNSMDMIQDILINDLGIPIGDIDTASFDDLRDNDFFGEQDQDLLIFDVENALRWIEININDTTNTRIFSVNGRITIGLLDQAPRVDETVPEINEDTIQARPSWEISDSKLVNQVRVRWSYSYGLKKFTASRLYKNDASIVTYGKRKELEIKLFGFTDSAIAANRANRLLARLSTPTPTIKVQTHLSNYDINLAEDVRLVHRYLPQQGGGLGFNDVMEVLSKGVSGLEKGSTVNFTLEFTSYTGIRLGLISPSPKLDLLITDQKTFTVPDGDCYRQGYRLRLFDNVNNVYFSDPVNTILSVVGNVVTMENNFTTILGVNVTLKLSGYDEASGSQRARYAYISPDAGVFTIDNSKSYQIIF